MDRYCQAELPQEYCGKVVLPVRIEGHLDASAHASKTHGFDQNGLRCYYQHAFTLTEERFDVDEFPLEISVYEEKVRAWRLIDGKWIKIKAWADQLDLCRKRVFVQPPEISEEVDIAR